MRPDETQTAYGGELLRGPHCDPLVLLHPSDCGICSEYTEAINERIHKGINFTGDTHPGRAQCPAEALRPLADIHAWVGNRPVTQEALHDA